MNFFKKSTLPLSKILTFTMLVFVGVVTAVIAFEPEKLPKDPTKARELMLGGFLKSALENMHLAKMKIDDDASYKALKEFIKKLDYGKQYLLKTDIDEFERRGTILDDELESGKLDFMEKAFERLKEREDNVKKFVMNRLKEKFEFTQDVKLETDPEKRSFAKNEQELKDLWEKILKYEVLSEYADLKQEQDDTTSKDKDKKKKKKLTETKGKKLNESQLLAKSIEEVTKRYTKIFDRKDNRKRDFMLDKFYNSFTSIFDPHTYYLIPEEKDGFDIDMSGKLEGIGALLREDGIYIKVEDVIPGSPSWKSKQIHKDDIILKVGQGKSEPVDIVNLGVQEAVKLIRGKKGTEVRLTVKKADGLVKEVNLIRDVVELEESYVKTVKLQKKDSKGTYGYINLPKFYRDFNNRNGRNCTDDVRSAIEQLNKSNVGGLILDLRNNGGGALIDASMMSGLFIKQGPIVQVKASTGSVEVLDDKDPNVQFNKPMIVLVNNNSASASEIVAAALQDYGRAIIVGGEHTHGKGTVQQVVDLDSYVPPISRAYTPFGAIKITVQKFYRINGSSTQYKGVTPDIILPDVMSVLEKGERFLDYSLPWGQVAAVDYTPWTEFSVDKNKLADNSSDRVKKSPRFKKIFDSIDWYKTRKDDTSKSLDMAKFLADRDLILKKSKEFEELPEANKSVVVQSLVKEKKDEEIERFKKLEETLQKDPFIDESISILDDMVEQVTKKTAKK
jgi:carboxyl-terminal processing protease